MNPEPSRLRQEEQLQAAAPQQQASKAAATEFATVEELLRHDSDLNPVPEAVAGRLEASIAREPKPDRSWFKKLFG